MKRLFPFFTLLFLFSLGLGCGRSEKKEETKKAPPTRGEETTVSETEELNGAEKKVVARVNGEPIYEEDLMGRPLKSVIADEIIYREGLRQGLDKKFEKNVEDYKKGLIVDSIKREIMLNLPKDEEISDEEIENYYEKNKRNYTYIRIKEIAVEDRGIAEEIHKRALQGGEFEKIVSDYSTSGKKVTVTERFVTRRQYKRGTFGKKGVGGVSDIIQEGNQFKILKITEVRKIPLPKVKNAIKHTIQAHRTGQAVNEFVEKLKKENNVKVEVLSGEGK